MISTALYETVRTASMMTNRVLVGLSGGKDSVVTLDICARFFRHVQPFFLYLVPGLEFQERTLRYYEKRFGVEIVRAPHFMLSEFLRYGVFRMHDTSVPIVSTRETYDWLREKTGIYWIACGERITDSIIRRAMIKKSGSIDAKRGRIYPIAYWNKGEVMQHLKVRKLPLSEENRALGFSFRSLAPDNLIPIKTLYPEDYARMVAWFPLLEASIKQHEFFGEVRHGEGEE